MWVPGVVYLLQYKDAMILLSIIYLLRDLGKMGDDKTHNEFKFLGYERPLGLESPKNLH